MGDVSVCCICFSVGDENVETTWTCNTCNTKCHLTCISNWAQTNHNRYSATFSCPVCRHMYPLASVVGTDATPSTTHYVDYGRSGLATFITSVLRSTSAVQHDPVVQQEDEVRDTVAETTERAAASSSSQSRGPLVVVNGTGTITIGRVTVVNHF